MRRQMVTTMYNNNNNNNNNNYLGCTIKVIIFKVHKNRSRFIGTWTTIKDGED